MVAGRTVLSRSKEEELRAISCHRASQFRCPGGPPTQFKNLYKENNLQFRQILFVNGPAARTETNNRRNSSNRIEISKIVMKRNVFAESV